MRRFATETRATDAQARAKFHGYWRCFGAGVVVIRWLFLVAICCTAERQWRAVQGGGIDRKHRAAHNLRYGIHFHASSHLNPEGKRHAGSRLIPKDLATRINGATIPGAEARVCASARRSGKRLREY
jgi:hypothetical protein